MKELNTSTFQENVMEILFLAQHVVTTEISTKIGLTKFTEPFSFEIKKDFSLK